jgi:copper(I)-binding protein
MNRVVERAFGWAACAASIALLAAALWLGAPASAAERLRASDAVVRLPAVGGRPAAGYVTLHGGVRDDELVSAASPLAERVELHGNSMAGGVMRMNALPSVRVRAGQQVAFSPGGMHMMIFGLRADAKAGAAVPLRLKFRSGAEVRVDAVAVAPGAAITQAH